MTETELPPQISATAGGRVELNLQAFGVPYTLRLFDGSVLTRVTALLPRPSEPAEAPSSPEPDAEFELAREADGTVRVLQGPRQLLASRDLELSLWVLSDLVHEYVCYSATTGLFVRGAAVVYEDRAIVILGQPLSGRSTLADELVRLGARHWADSYMLLNEAGRLLPFESPHGRATEAGARDADTPSASSGPFIGLVVKTLYRPGTKWEALRQSSGEAMLALLAETVAVHGRSAEAMPALQKAVSGAILLSGDRGEASDAANIIMGALAARTVI